MRIKNGFYYGSVAIRLCSWYFISITCSYLSLFFTTAIIIDLYKDEGAAVKAYLPPDDDISRRNVLYKQIFEAFDRIDGKPSKEALRVRAGLCEFVFFSCRIIGFRL